jgi:hypothetical protein
MLLSLSLPRQAGFAKFSYSGGRPTKHKCRLKAIAENHTIVNVLWRGKAWHGRAGQAFELVESGVVDRATANSLPRTATGHKQDDQAAKTKPPAGSCLRILDQSLGSTRARSSRNRPLE